MTVLLWAEALVAAILLLLWAGLQIVPRPFAPLDAAGAAVERVPLPEGLPEPVEHFYHRLYGDEIPVIESAAISGRARLRIMGIAFPSRFRFTHDAGESYSHSIEATIFGIPLMRVNERYAGGHARLELPFGVTEGPRVDQGANLALWAEAVWFPSVWVTDPRTSWEAIDDETAVLVVPYGDEHQRFVARFDAESGMLRLLESMRYKGEESVGKTLWINEVKGWGSLEGETVATEAEVTWFDEGTAWAVFRVEEVVYNAGVE